MGKTVRITTTIYKDVLHKIDLYARLNHEDRATAIRQLIAEGLRNKFKDNVIDEFKQGRLTIREAADLLGVNYWQINDILEEEKVSLIR
jgi:metal-responsive CopG/Arc/MetJ family transcriptional regulator